MYVTFQCECHRGKVHQGKKTALCLFVFEFWAELAGWVPTQHATGLEMPLDKSSGGVSSRQSNKVSTIHGNIFVLTWIKGHVVVVVLDTKLGSGEKRSFCMVKLKPYRYGPGHPILILVGGEFYMHFESWPPCSEFQGARRLGAGIGRKVNYATKGSYPHLLIFFLFLPGSCQISLFLLVIHLLATLNDEMANLKHFMKQ